MKPLRRIAAHRLWTPQGVVEHPVVTLSPEGRLLELRSCAEPDRLAGTEFYAGVLVCDFPADYAGAFAAMQRRGGSLAALLPGTVPARPGRTVAISGVDYATLELTDRARIVAL